MFKYKWITVVNYPGKNTNKLAVFRRNRTYEHANDILMENKKEISSEG